MKYIEQFQKGYKPPFQEQSDAPGLQAKLNPQPINDVTADGKPYKASGKLEEQSVIITGADSGIGLSTAILFGDSLLRLPRMGTHAYPLSSSRGC